ncbi:hypothetical protein FOA52_015589 [Chlamydomonas sp. UWO 241]|nr:hypothetical protein FOA52_015589 [Chlamydomonas sp. UWO 241]
MTGAWSASPHNLLPDAAVALSLLPCRRYFRRYRKSKSAQTGSRRGGAAIESSSEEAQEEEDASEEGQDEPSETGEGAAPRRRSSNSSTQLHAPSACSGSPGEVRRGRGSDSDGDYVEPSEQRAGPARAAPRSKRAKHLEAASGADVPLPSLRHYATPDPAGGWFDPVLLDPVYQQGSTTRDPVRQQGAPPGTATPHPLFFQLTSPGAPQQTAAHHAHAHALPTLDGDHQHGPAALMGPMQMQLPVPPSASRPPPCDHHLPLTLPPMGFAAAAGHLAPTPPACSLPMPRLGVPAVRVKREGGGGGGGGAPWSNKAPCDSPGGVLNAFIDAILEDSESIDFDLLGADTPASPRGSGGGGGAPKLEQPMPMHVGYANDAPPPGLGYTQPPAGVPALLLSSYARGSSAAAGCHPPEGSSGCGRCDDDGHDQVRLSAAPVGNAGAGAGAGGGLGSGFQSLQQPHYQQHHRHALQQGQQQHHLLQQPHCQQHQHHDHHDHHHALQQPHYQQQQQRHHDHALQQGQQQGQQQQHHQHHHDDHDHALQQPHYQPQHHHHEHEHGHALQQGQQQQHHHHEVDHHHTLQQPHCQQQHHHRHVLQQGQQQQHHDHHDHRHALQQPHYQHHHHEHDHDHALQQGQQQQQHHDHHDHHYQPQHHHHHEYDHDHALQQGQQQQQQQHGGSGKQWPLPGSYAAHTAGLRHFLLAQQAAGVTAAAPDPHALLLPPFPDLAAPDTTPRSVTTALSPSFCGGGGAPNFCGGGGALDFGDGGGAPGFGGGGGARLVTARGQLLPAPGTGAHVDGACYAGAASRGVQLPAACAQPGAALAYQEEWPQLWSGTAAAHGAL